MLCYSVKVLHSHYLPFPCRVNQRNSCDKSEHSSFSNLIYLRTLVDLDELVCFCSYFLMGSYGIEVIVNYPSFCLIRLTTYRNKRIACPNLPVSRNTSHNNFILSFREKCQTSKKPRKPTTDRSLIESTSQLVQTQLLPSKS